MFRVYSLYDHYIFTICSLYIHCIFTIYALYVHYMFTDVYSVYVQYISPTMRTLISAAALNQPFTESDLIMTLIVRVIDRRCLFINQS